MKRIECNVSTGEVAELTLTPEEEAAAAAALAAETAANQPDVVAPIRVDAIDRLQFEVMFDMENRMRAREGLAAITRAQYRTALINRWKALNQ
jgi:hypothetical protein